MAENFNNLSGYDNHFGRPLLAAMLQLINAPLMVLFTEFAKHLGLTRLSVLDVMSLLVLPKPNFWVGNVVSLIYGFWLGLFIYYGPKWLGLKHFPVKAMLLCMSQESWLFNIFGILARNQSLFISVQENFADAAISAIGGLIGGSLMQKFLFPKTAPQEGDPILSTMLFGIAPLFLLEGSENSWD